jgi:hypothetical protein
MTNTQSIEGGVSMSSMKVMCVWCAVALATVVWAQPGGGGGAGGALTPNYNTLIGNSDAVVLATVTAATIPELVITTVGGGMMGSTGTATVTVKVTKVFSGTVSETSLTVQIPLSVNRSAVSGAARQAAWTPDVSIGKNVVIGLVKAQDGLQLTPAATGGFGGFSMGMSSVYTEAEAAAIATAITAYPLKATLTAPTTALIIGQKVTVTVTVKNTGATALTLNDVAMSSIQNVAKMNAAATFVKVSDNVRDANGQAKSLAGGATTTITAVFTVMGPANWQLFAAELFPMASNLSATVTASTTETVAAGGGPGGGMGGPGGGMGGPGGGMGAPGGTVYSAKSGWVNAQLTVPKA